MSNKLNSMRYLAIALTLTVSLGLGKCCISSRIQRDDAGGFLVRGQVENDLRNVLSDLKYEYGKYPAGYLVRLKYLQRGKACDTTHASARELSRHMVLNFTYYKNRGVGLCDPSKYLECDYERRRCDCMKVYTGYMVDKEGPYYLAWDEEAGECRATENSYCDRKFKCGKNYTCKRVQCVCNMDNTTNNVCPTFRRRAELKPKFLDRNNTATTIDIFSIQITILLMFVSVLGPLFFGNRR